MIIQGSPDILSTEFGLNNQSALGFVVTVDTSQTELEQYLAQRALQYQRADIEANLYDLSEAIGQAETLAQQQAAQAAYATAELAAQQATQSVAAFQQVAAQAAAQIAAREQAQFAENIANAQAIAVEQAAYVATSTVDANTTQYEIDQIIAARKIMNQYAIDQNAAQAAEKPISLIDPKEFEIPQSLSDQQIREMQVASNNRRLEKEAAAAAANQAAAGQLFDQPRLPEPTTPTATSGINPALVLAAVAAYFIVG